MPLSDYECLGLIGQGMYGEVFKRKKLPNHFVAVKRFKTDYKKKRTDDGISPSGIREIKLLRELRHPRIVSLLDVEVDTQRRLHLVFDWVEHDLGEMIHWHRTMQRPMTPMRAKSILWQTLDALVHLHSNWVMHRDLKPANILIGSADAATDAGQVKLADFGLARLFQDPLEPLPKSDQVVVTIWYRAPELLLGAKHYNSAVDTWALGCILAELGMLAPLFKGREEKREEKGPMPFQSDQVDKIFEICGTPESRWPAAFELPEWPRWNKYVETQQKPEIRPDQLDRVLRKSWLRAGTAAFDLLRKMLHLDPNQRTCPAELLEHPYFKEDPKPNEKNIFAPPDRDSDTYPRRVPKKAEKGEEKKDHKRQKVDHATTKPDVSWEQAQVL